MKTSLACAAFIGLAVLASPVQGQDYEYSTNCDDGTLTITGYLGPGGEVTIPARINNRLVTGIYYAFYDCTNLTAVTIPEGVISLGDGAFSGCVNLTNILMADSVTDIGQWAFRRCTGLTRIDLPNSLTNVGYAAFYRCTNLVAINAAPASSNFSSLDGVLFDKSQTTLVICPGGKPGSYTVPNSVTNIQSQGFFGCNRLTRIIIPASVIAIELGFYWNDLEGGLTECGSLASIDVDPANPTYTSVDGVLFDKDQRTLLCCPQGRVGHYVVPNGVTSIGTGEWVWGYSGWFAFAGCTSPKTSEDESGRGGMAGFVGICS